MPVHPGRNHDLANPTGSPAARGHARVDASSIRAAGCSNFLQPGAALAQNQSASLRRREATQTADLIAIDG